MNLKADGYRYPDEHLDPHEMLMFGCPFWIKERELCQCFIAIWHSPYITMFFPAKVKHSQIPLKSVRFTSV